MILHIISKNYVKLNLKLHQLWCLINNWLCNISKFWICKAWHMIWCIRVYDWRVRIPLCTWGGHIVRGFLFSFYYWSTFYPQRFMSRILHVFLSYFLYPTAINTLKKDTLYSLWFFLFSPSNLNSIIASRDVSTRFYSPVWRRCCHVMLHKVTFLGKMLSQ